MARYKVFFHAGDELGLKTKVRQGLAWLDGSELRLEGPSVTFAIPIKDLKDVRLFRLHGLGRVVQVDHAQGRLYVSVVRLMIGQFAFINFFKTGELFRQISALTHSSESEVRPIVAPRGDSSRRDS